MAPIQSNKSCSPGIDAKKRFLASGLLPGLCGPLNMCSNVTPIMPLCTPWLTSFRKKMTYGLEKLEKFHKD